MDAYATMQPELGAAWEAVEAQAGKLPEPLAEVGRKFFASVSDGAAGHRGYFSNVLAPPLLYIPLWLRERLRRDGTWQSPADAELVRILAATMWGYFYIRIQDDVIDDPQRVDWELLLFGNICGQHMHRLFREALGGSVAFWAAFDAAWTEFTRRTLEEQRQVRTDLPYTESLFFAHAAKVAFARVPALAVCILGGRADLAEAIATLIDQLGMAYGLVNDVLGWPRDLIAGQRTYLLARAGRSPAELGASSGQPSGRPAPEQVQALEERLRATLYDGGLLVAFLEEAARWQSRAAETAEALGLIEFRAYTRERLGWLDEQKKQRKLIQLQRALLGAGAGAGQ